MAPDTLSLEGKIAIITGSGKENGIGAGIARALVRNGARVVINYVSDATAPRAAGVVDSIRENGGQAIAVRADVSTQEGASKIVTETLKAFKADKVDILGISPPRSFSVLHNSIMVLARVELIPVDCQ